MIQAAVGDQSLADLELLPVLLPSASNIFGYTWVDYTSYQLEQLRILPADKDLLVSPADYNSMQLEMFFGAVPKSEGVLEHAKTFQDKFNGVEATV